MGTLSFIDSAFPLQHPPASDGVCLYIGGDATNVWSRADIDAQPARYRLPIFVRSDPPGPGAAADVAAALSQLAAVGAPKGILLCWDMETAADPSYIRGVWALLREVGYPLIVYGTQSDVFGNDNPGGLYFGAQWTGAAHIAAGDQMTQFVAFSNLDEDEAESTLPFWDTKPAPAPPPEDDMGVTGTIPSTEASWVATFVAGSCTWLAIGAGPVETGKGPQQVTISAHSASKGWNQEVTRDVIGQKWVMDFTEKDVDEVGMLRGGNPESWTPVAFNAG